jgi:hypothetical protein
MDMTLAQRAVAFVAIVFLFLLACFALAAYDKMARPELRLTKLIGEYSERTINSPGGSRRIWIFDFDTTFRPA